jgi:hypothetical protein
MTGQREQSSYAPTVPRDIEPPELAELVDFAERPRAHDWSLRSALVRYAQPQPQRVEELLDLVRRTDWALSKQRAVIERQGDDIWGALQPAQNAAASAELTNVVELLRAAVELDRLGEVLAAWAVDISGERPDVEVDRVIADVAAKLDALGVPHEDRRPPPSRRRG